LKTLRKIKFFKENGVTSDNELEQILAGLKLVEYQSNEVVFNFGDKGDAFYLVLDGIIEVYQPI
jgi:CRP-like cAMP-binding protein